MTLAAVSLASVFIILNDLENLQEDNDFVYLAESKNAVLDVDQKQDTLMQATDILLGCGDDGNCLAYNLETLSKLKTQDEFLAIAYNLVSEFE